MTELLLIFLICLVGAEALQRRQQSELAERLIRHYCQNNDLQLLSVARQSFGIPLLLARVRSYYSETFRELLHRKQRVDDEMEALFGAMIAISDRIADGGPSGNTLIH